MRYINISDQVKRIVKNRVMTQVMPGGVINLDTADINHSSSALRFFELYVHKEEKASVAKKQLKNVDQDKKPTNNSNQNDNAKKIPTKKEKADVQNNPIKENDKQNSNETQKEVTGKNEEEKSQEKKESVIEDKELKTPIENQYKK